LGEQLPLAALSAVSLDLRFEEPAKWKQVNSQKISDKRGQAVPSTFNKKFAVANFHYYLGTRRGLGPRTK